jgi:hypothetical protein
MEQSVPLNEEQGEIGYETVQLTIHAAGSVLN